MPVLALPAITRNKSEPSISFDLARTLSPLTKTPSLPSLPATCKGFILYAFLLTTGTQSLTRWYCCRYGNDVRSPAYVTPNKCPIIGALGVQIKVNEFRYMPPFEVAWCNLIKVKK
jgi:hypothetical protein